MATTAYQELTIAQAADAVGVSPHTIRYYERAGLLTPIDRNGSGHRRFTEEDIAWLVTCTRLRATGMPIRRIREYAELVVAGDGNEATRLEILEAHRREVVERMREIEHNLEAIDRKIELYRARACS
jgi:DNA-binding transcriptional MerR regulator